MWIVNGDRAPIMADVARAAGVSHQTVSRVLNDHPNVRPTTRDRVLVAIRELGYRPNVAARTLVTRRTRTLGVIGFNTTLYGPASMLYGIEQAAKQHDYFVTVAALAALDRRSVLDAVERLRDQAVEGIIVIAPQTTAVGALANVPSDVPLVAVGCGTHASLASVAMDNEAGAQRATSYLLDLGHRTVHHLAGPASWLDAQEREVGWRRALESRGSPVPEPLTGGDWSARTGFERGLRLARDLAVTSVFCANDHMALGLLRALQQAGRRIPEDVSVIGFDDIPEAEYFGPPLTTVRQDFDELGRRALGSVISLIDMHKTRGGSPFPGRPSPGCRSNRAWWSARPPPGRPRPTRADRNRPALSTSRHREIHFMDVSAHQNAPGDRYVIGVDFGTLSGRALVVRVADGAELGMAVHDYAHGVLDKALPSGVALPPDWALQHPDDYRDVLRRAVPAALADAGVDPARVVGIGIDFTACTVLPTLADGTPLCELAEYRDRPHAYVKLWRHHAAQPQADRINSLAHKRSEKWIGRYGGKISAEWEYAKGLQLLAEDPEIYARAARWIEAADWITWQLCGVETRNACTAGYKGLLWDGVRPSREFLAALNPDFADFDAKLDLAPGRPGVSPLGTRAGDLTARAAAWTGLPAGVAVCVGNVDAHVTAPAARAIEPGQMVAIMGTSTCHVMSGERLAEVPGMCGVVDGGIVGGLWGYEAGQSGVGDIFAWFTGNATPAEVRDAAATRGISVHDLLTERAAAQPVGAHGLIALDWHSGNRSVLVDHHLSGVIVGLTLDTRPHEVYRALLEATAFGTRVIIDAFERGGVPVNELIVAGGLVRNSFLMQLYADVTRRPLSLIGSSQGPALGAAIHAAVAEGAYPDVPAAARAMGNVERAAYLPDPERAAAYDLLYDEYLRLHDYFGLGENKVLHRLREIRLHAHGAAARDENANIDQEAS